MRILLLILLLLPAWVGAFDSSVRDAALGQINTATRVTVTSAEPANYAGIAAVLLASKAVTTPGSVTDSVLTLAEQLDLTATGTGSGTHYCFDDGSTLLGCTTLATAIPVSSGMTVDVGAMTVGYAAAGITYLINEDFEGVTGNTAPSGWSTATANMNYEYDTDPISGLQSFYMTATVAPTVLYGVSAAEVWHVSKFRPISLPSANTTFYEFRDGATARAFLVITSAGVLQASMAGAGASSTSSGYIVAGDEYEVRARVKQATIAGDDAEFDVYVRPVGGSWTTLKEQRNGTVITTTDRHYFLAHNGMSLVIDDVQIAEEALW